jgi:hypothetical protein
MMTKMEKKAIAEANPNTLKIQMMVATQNSEHAHHATKKSSKAEKKAAKGFEWQ